MRLPNKITSYSESVLGKLDLILNLAQQQDIGVGELYNLVRNSFETTSEFIEALDCLFALGKIVLMDIGGMEVLHYA